VLRGNPFYGNVVPVRMWSQKTNYRQSYRSLHRSQRTRKVLGAADLKRGGVNQAMHVSQQARKNSTNQPINSPQEELETSLKSQQVAANFVLLPAGACIAICFFCSQW
ncbi:unnamed protein product, partial [Ectocarpus fasciculatus]